MKIKVIRESILQDFEYWVNEHLKNGWILQGNMVIDQDAYMQVVSKQL